MAMSEEDVNRRFAEILEDAAAAEDEQYLAFAMMMHESIRDVLDSGEAGIRVIHDPVTRQRFVTVPENMVQGMAQALIDYMELGQECLHAEDIGASVIIAEPPMSHDQVKALAIWVATLTGAFIKDNEERTWE